MVTSDPAFAISAARIHPEAKVLVASPNQLPSRAADPFDVAVIDGGHRSTAIADRMLAEGTVERVLLVTTSEAEGSGYPSIARPFTLGDLVAALGLDPVSAAGPSRDPAAGGFVGRLLSRLGMGEQTPGPSDDAAGGPPGRIRAWPRVDREPATPDPDGFADAARAIDEVRERLAGLPVVGPPGEEAHALAAAAREALEGRSASVWLEDGGHFEAHGPDAEPGTRIGRDHPVVSALGEEVTAVLLAPSGPASDLVGGDAPAVVVAGLRHGGRLFGVVAVARRGLTVSDRDRLLDLAREHTPRLALARALRALREGGRPSPPPAG